MQQPPGRRKTKKRHVNCTGCHFYTTTAGGFPHWAMPRNLRIIGYYWLTSKGRRNLCRFGFTEAFSLGTLLAPCFCGAMGGSDSRACEAASGRSGHLVSDRYRSTPLGDALAGRCQVALAGHGQQSKDWSNQTNETGKWTGLLRDAPRRVPLNGVENPSTT